VNIFELLNVAESHSTKLSFSGLARRPSVDERQHTPSVDPAGWAGSVEVVKFKEDFVLCLFINRGL